MSAADRRARLQGVLAARGLDGAFAGKPMNAAAVEGIDSAIVDTMRHRRGIDSVTGLPDGNAWLYVDLDGDDADDGDERLGEGEAHAAVALGLDDDEGAFFF